LSDPLERPNLNWVIDELMKEISFYRSSNNNLPEQEEDQFSEEDESGSDSEEEDLRNRSLN
jgi:hypothetical protein